MKQENSNPSDHTKSASRTQRLAVLALLTAAALMIYAIESLLPTFVPIPGIRLGLANVITLITIKRYGARDALLVLLARIFLSCFFFGQFMSLLYSLCGGLFCMLVTWLICLLLAGNYLWIISIFGAIAHNLAQLAVAFSLTKTPGVLAYLPFLMISAILTGLFTGLCAHFTLKHLPAKR